MITMQLRTIVKLALGSADDSDDAQLARAVRSQSLNYFQDTGTANALVIAPLSAFTSLSQLVGVPLRIKKGANPNGGAMTLTVNGLAPVAITTETAAAMVPGAVPANSIFYVAYDGTQFQKIGGNSLAYKNAIFFKAVSAGTQSVPAGVITTLTDLGLSLSNFLDSTFSGGALTIGAKDAGTWLFNQTYTPNTTNLGGVQARLHINGVLQHRASSQNSTSSNGTAAVSGLVKVSAGDVVTFAVVQSTGSSATSTTDATVWSGTRIGD